MMFTAGADAAPPVQRTVRGRRRAPKARSLLVLRGVGAGVILAAAVVAARVWGGLSGPPAVGLAVVVGLAIPISRRFGVRCSVVGALILGWLPVAWWANLPIVAGHQMTGLLALGAGGLAGWCAGAQRPGERLKLLWPAWRVVDLVPVGAAAAGAIALWPLLAVRSAEQALTLATQSWDHVGHFAMFDINAEFGTNIGQVTQVATDQANSLYASYPQDYHAVLAAVTQLVSGEGSVTPGERLPLYFPAMAGVLIILIVAQVAALTVIGRLDTRPVVAALLAAGVVTVYAIGPGAGLIRAGFPNYVFACGMVGLGGLLGLQLRGKHVVMPLVAMAGCFIAAANNWLPLGVASGAGIVAALIPVVRSRWRGAWRRWAMGGAALAVVAVGGGLHAWVMIARPVEWVLQQGWGGSIPRFGESVSVTALTLALVAAAALRHRRGDGANRTRAPGAVALGVPLVAWIGVIAVIGVVAGVTIVDGKLDLEGSYYFIKAVAGLHLLAIPCAAGAIALSVRPPRLRAATSARARAGVALATAGGLIAGIVGVSSVYGPPSARVAAWLDEAPAPLIQLRTEATSPETPGAGRAALVLRAGRKQFSRPDTLVLWYPREEGAPGACIAESWIRALSRVLTGEFVNHRPCHTVADAVARLSYPAAAGELLAQWDNAVFTVDSPEAKAELVAELGDRALARIIAPAQAVQ
jgi:hypothetical protein